MSDKQRQPRKQALIKEPNMKRGEKGTETYNKDTEEAKSTKKRGGKGLEMKNRNKKDEKEGAK